MFLGLGSSGERGRERLSESSPLVPGELKWAPQAERAIHRQIIEEPTTMYTSRNFKTKKAFKEAVVAGEKVTVFAPGLGTPPENGTCCIEGPHYPEPHKWYAQATIKDGVVVKVS
jgi:hypothetical protein